MFNISLKYKYYFLNLENINSGFMEQFLIISILQKKKNYFMFDRSWYSIQFCFYMKQNGMLNMADVQKKCVSIWASLPFLRYFIVYQKNCPKNVHFFSSLALNYARNPYFGMKLQNYVNLIPLLYMSYVYQWFAMIW